MAGKVNIRYGTSLMPFFSENLLLIVPRSEDFADSSVFPPSRNASPPVNKKPPYSKKPSISVILSATEDNSILYTWQKQRIQEMGLASFRKYMTERMTLGTSMHSAAQKLLVAVKKQELPASDKIITYVGLDPKSPASKYVMSIVPIIGELKKDDVIAYEKPVTSPKLGFQGRFDAVFQYRGETCMVDWKTSPAASSFSKQGDESMSYQTYSRQVAAYAAAFNNDGNFQAEPMVSRGLLVSAKEDGTPADVFELDQQNIEKSYDDFKGRLWSFWEKLRTAKPHNGFVDFAYTP
ncbi:unnamed protein product [Caenorhabditis auriculariae]|uniref:Mitochondrial genome maintenance exonuclease 1 n=1 Tax=Caenorhabditis auriculariae TaxID=2777116 RepID=A0A8S1H2F4_9PELO|nr:unnamed protein product [Caenorhabditis auriculariae]